MKTKKEYSTHMPMLIKTVQHTKGPVIELGSGLFSTPLLHWLCAETKRLLVTYERNPEYYEHARMYRSKNHRITLIDNWNKIDAKRHWSVALIDQDIDRDKTAILLKDSVDYIVMHDSELEKSYGYDTIWKHFKYRYDWKACRPWTSVVSNFKDVSWLERKD